MHNPYNCITLALFEPQMLGLSVLIEFLLVLNEQRSITTLLPNEVLQPVPFIHILCKTQPKWSDDDMLCNSKPRDEIQ